MIWYHCVKLNIFNNPFLMHLTWKKNVFGQYEVSNQTEVDQLWWSMNIVILNKMI